MNGTSTWRSCSSPAEYCFTSLCASGATLVKVCHACLSVTGDTSSSCQRAVYLLTREKKKKGSMRVLITVCGSHRFVLAAGMSRKKSGSSAFSGHPK